MTRPIKISEDTKGGLYAAGDYVVPSYTETGRLKGEPLVIGNERQILDNMKKILEHATHNKGRPDPARSEPTAKIGKGKRGRANRTPKVEVVNVRTEMARIQEENQHMNMDQEFITEPYHSNNTLDVVFTTAFGKITLTTIGVIEAGIALALVFKDEKDIKFEPNSDTEVSIDLKNKTFRVYYPGITLTWLDGRTQIMLFMKINKEENE